VIDWLRRLFGRKAAPVDAASDPFQDRLAEFVNSADRTPIPGEAPREKTGSREMIEAARQPVDAVELYFRGYVTEKVLRRFGNEFRLEMPTQAQTRDLDARFGDPKTGNEYRYVTVAFKDRFQLVLRVQAMILSRDVPIKVLFIDVKASYVVQELDLSRWSSLAEVRWEQVFEKVFVDFFDWHKKTL
jgi:hypothetical protein